MGHSSTKRSLVFPNFQKCKKVLVRKNVVRAHYKNHTPITTYIKKSDWLAEVFAPIQKWLNSYHDGEQNWGHHVKRA